jgi:hypothetical protein
LHLIQGSRRPGIRASGAALAALSVAAVLPGSALAYDGAYVRGHTFRTTEGAHHLLIRIACPARTQSTPRPGDFSFCTGRIVVRWHGRVVATGPFSIRTFDSHVERIQVLPAQRHVFQPHRHLQLGWTTRSHDGQPQWATRRGSIEVYNPFSSL